MSLIKTTQTRRQVLIAGSLAWLAAQTTQAAAETYPDHPIRIVVGFSPGGAVDVLARLIAQGMGDKFGQSAFVENRPGANSDIGANFVAHSAPNGYTLLMMTTSHALNAIIQPDPDFDPIKSFAPITEVAKVPNVVLVRASLPVSTLQDLINLTKAAPGKYSFASTGIGGATQLAGEAFKQAAGVNLLHVPYQGAGPALTALLAGQVDAYFGSVSGAKTYVDGGQLKALAIPSKTRSSAMPDVPTSAEAGLPSYLFDTWYGLMAPAGTPQPVLDKILSEVREIMKEPTVQKRLTTDGAEPVLSSPTDFRNFLTDEITRLRVVAKNAGLNGH